MNDFFEIVDWSTGNVIDDFDTEEEALADLLTEGRRYGFDDIRTYALLRYQDGHPTLIAMEDDLIAYVQRLNDYQAMSCVSVADAASKVGETPALNFKISSHMEQLTNEDSVWLGSHFASITALGATAALARGLVEVHRIDEASRSIAEQMLLLTDALYSATVGIDDLLGSVTARAVGVGQAHQLVGGHISTFSAMAEAISSAVVVAELLSSKTLHVPTTYDLVLGVAEARATQGDSSARNSTETTRLELVELSRAA